MNLGSHRVPIVRLRLAVSIAGLVLSLIAAGCNMPGFEPSVEPLDIPDAPAAPEFGPVDPEAPPPELESESQPPLVMEPVESEPHLDVLCTSTLMYIRSSPGKPAADSEDNSLGLLEPGTQVTWTGNQAEAAADGQVYTWYEIETETGLNGWSASDWLTPDECSQTLVAGGFPRIIDFAGYTGSRWLGETANCEDCTHYGVDVGPGAGDSNLYAPWAGEVVAYDSCEGCPEGGGNTYDLDRPTDESYNWGYGATVIVEYAYEDIDGADLQRLRSNGIDLQPGQSMYMMVTHLDRQADNPEAGTALSAGDAAAVMDNSGNSEGLHAHVEVAVNDSGLTQQSGTTLYGFWWNSVAEVDWASDTIEGRQGNRVDPAPLFNLP